MKEGFFYKSAWIHTLGRRVLVARSKGNTVFFFPGGGPEKGETSEQTLIREVKEELGADIVRRTIRLLGIFEAPSFEFPETIPIRMSCYAAAYRGRLIPSSEVEEIAWFSYLDRDRVSMVDGVVFDYLKEKGEIT